jgi:lipid A 4'-phosphatase
MNPLRWRARHRSAALCGALLLLAAIVFNLWPQLDLLASAQFFAADGRFVGNDNNLVRLLHRWIPRLGWAAALAGLAVAVVWRHGPRGVIGMRWWRRLQVLALVMLLGVGALVNGVLKEGWGRARPVAVQAFGGDRQFTPAGVISRQCPTNCSFVTGHGATGFALMAVGLFGSVATRRRWWWVGMAAGSIAGLARISQGGHFLSDVVFAALAVWASCCLLREAWLRLAARRQNRRHSPVRSPTP